MTATTIDPLGRRVHLSDERWEHIKVEHETLAAKLGEILAAIREPIRSMPGRGEHEVWFFGEAAGRYPWIQVVVHYEGEEGWVATAFPRSALPSR